MKIKNLETITGRILKRNRDLLFYFNQDGLCDTILLEDSYGYNFWCSKKIQYYSNIRTNSKELTIIVDEETNSELSISTETFELVCTWLVEGYSLKQFIRDLFYQELNKEKVQIFSEKAKNNFNCKLKNYPLARMILHIASDGRAYYFNNDGILCIASSEYEISKEHPLNGNFSKYGFEFCCPRKILNRFEKRFKILNDALESLPEGSSLDDFETVVNTIRLERSDYYSEIERFITKIEKPTISKAPESPVGTFDYIKVRANINTNWPDKKSYLIKNKHSISQMVLEKIATSKEFAKYGVPVSFLEVQDIIAQNNFMSIIYTFGLKEL